MASPRSPLVRMFGGTSHTIGRLRSARNSAAVSLQRVLREAERDCPQMAETKNRELLFEVETLRAARDLLAQAPPLRENQEEAVLFGDD